jgi:hypothetical protein
VKNTVLVDRHNYYFVKPEDDVVLVDASEMGDISITLPINNIENGKTFWVKNIRNTTKKTILAIGDGNVYFDYFYPSIELPGASACEVVYYNGCYHILNLLSL